MSQRAFTVSLWGAVGGVAAALGPSLGSAIAETMGWSWAFFINLPVGVLSLWFGARLLAPSPHATVQHKVDLIGMTLLIVAVGAIALAIVETGSPAWTPTELTAVTAISVFAGGGFVVWAGKVRAPLIDLNLFRNS